MKSFLAYLVIFFCFNFSNKMTSYSEVIVGGYGRDVVTIQELKEEILAAGTVSIQCTASKMCIILSKSWLKGRWDVERLTQISLRVPCDGQAKENGSHVVLCTQGLKLSVCGTELSANDTHITFENKVTVTDNRNIGIIGAPDYHRSFPFKCIYPSRILVGVQYLPNISMGVQFFGKEIGQGRFKVTIVLYEDDQYETAYQQSPLLTMDDDNKLRVRVLLIEGPPTTKMQLVRCWATPNADQTAEKYALIRNYCPVENAAEVEIISNGEYTHATWESKVFRFSTESTVYLHCNVRVCFDEDCNKTCKGQSVQRKRREVDEDVIVSLGPIRTGNDVLVVFPDEQEVYDEVVQDVTNTPVLVANQEEFILGIPQFSVHIGLVVIAIIAIVSIAAAVGCLVRKRRAIKRLDITSKRNTGFWQKGDGSNTESIVADSQLEIPKQFK